MKTDSNTGSYDPNIAYQNLQSPFDASNFNGKIRARI